VVEARPQGRADNCFVEDRMPRDLFGDVAVRPPSIRSRRSPVVVASITVHVLVVVATLLATAIAPDILPMPREALAFYEPARFIDIELPPPPAPRSATAPPQMPTVSQYAAPVVAPTSIVPETWAPAYEPAVNGVVNGVVDTIGTNIVSAPDPPPAPVTTTPKDPVRMHRGITAPDKVVNVAPVYPPLARSAHIEGYVILETVIDVSGNVTSVRVLQGHPMLDPAALDAVQQWKFTPARLNDEAIPVVMTVTVQFKLQ
jgi:periplasmic protein TonB